MTRRGASAGQGGFALLIVLWTLAGLSLLVSIVIATADAGLRGVYALRSAAQLQDAADGEVWDAVFHVMDRSAARWSTDGRAYVTRVGGVEATLRVRSEAGLVNPNSAPRPLLAALLQECGATREQAASIAANMVDWRSTAQADRAASQARYLAAGLNYRPPGGPFQSVGEVGLVLGMTPGLLQAVRPHLSVTQPNDPDARQADPVVRQALRRAGGPPVPPPSAGENRPGSVVVDVTVRDGQGGQATRRAVILLTPGTHAGAALSDMVHVVRLRS